MLLGVCLYVVSHVALIMPFGTDTVSIWAFVILEACAFSLVMPRRDSIIAILIDPEERARINAMITSVSLAITIPFGATAGFLSDIDRRFTFMVNIAIFVIAFVIIIANRKFLSEKISTGE